MVDFFLGKLFVFAEWRKWSVAFRRMKFWPLAWTREQRFFVAAAVAMGILAGVDDVTAKSALRLVAEPIRFPADPDPFPWSSCALFAFTHVIGMVSLKSAIRLEHSYSLDQMRTLINRLYEIMTSNRRKSQLKFDRL